MTLYRINLEYGDAAIAPGTRYPSQEVTPTGIPSLDAAIGGGVPRGRIIEIHGEEASGKTSLALFLSGAVGGPTLYIDADAALSVTSLVNAWYPPDALGAFYVSRPETLEAALTITEIAAKAFSAIVIDSIPALPTKTELEGETPTNDRTTAAMLSRYLPRLASRCKRTGATLILINQLRTRPRAIFTSPDKPTGGQAIKYFSALTLQTFRGELLKEPGPGNDFTGQTCIVECRKCKYAVPGRRATLRLTYWAGFQDHISELQKRIAERR